MNPFQSIKCVVVGDRTVGKTSMLYLQKLKYIPKHFKLITDFTSNVEMNGEKIILEPCDTTALEDYDQLRSLSYTYTDIFIVCFSLVSPPSLENVQNKWIPEITKHCPGIPFLLVGTKMDLRDKICTVLEKDESQAKGRAVAKEIGALKYLECSVLLNLGVNEVFNEAIRIGLCNNRHSRQKDIHRCLVA